MSIGQIGGRPKRIERTEDRPDQRHQQVELQLDIERPGDAEHIVAGRRDAENAERGELPGVELAENRPP